MIALFKRLKQLNLPYSNAGSPIKTIFSFNSKNHCLVPVRDINLDDKIQSYFDETNYKALIEKLHSTDSETLRETIIRTYPNAKQPFYGDISAFNDDLMPNIEFMREVLGLYDLSQNFDISAQNQPLIKNEEEKNEKKEVINNG